MNGQDLSVAGQVGVWTYRVAGRLSHKIGSLLQPSGVQPKFAQIYIYGGNDVQQAHVRNEANQNKCDTDILITLQGMMRRVNPYYTAFRTAMERLADHPTHTFVLKAHDPKETAEDKRRYNTPITNEVAALYLGDEDAENCGRDLIIQSRDGPLTRIDELHRSFLPLHFSLLFHHGEDGWAPNIPSCRRGRGGSDSISQSQFFGFHLFERLDHFSTAHYCGRLFQELIVDCWAQTESNRLRWVEQNQKQLRSDTYKGLSDALHDGDHLQDVGNKIILPSSFSGSARNMMQLFQDAMRIVSEYGKPDLFLTMTCNPVWPEIQRHLKPGQSAEDRPDIVSRVFKLKLDAMLAQILKTDHGGPVLGKVSPRSYFCADTIVHCTCVCDRISETWTSSCTHPPHP